VKKEEDSKNIAANECGRERERERVIAMPDYRKASALFVRKKFFEDKVSEMKEQHYFVLCNARHNESVVEMECGEII
jgi:hypothetical protein